MALEQFNTQILLLHSERSTLDRLSSGFADRYTVHCATSGSEALNTLGQTNIDVIVSAQELPGMSGLDALREAKRRSPETVGILLASDGIDDAEALVGADEVFQIVRGTVTPESLRGLIDGATQQSRLMHLTKSANDTAANMDSPAEHIVMETSENGASIITDVTGQVPALDPGKFENANVGSDSVDVVVLSKDEEFLTTVRESARGMHKIIAASTLAQAEKAVAEKTVGVAVIDAAMVGDNVEKLTVHLRGKSPRLVSIIAGRRDDGEMLMDLINRGKVYRFLLKPVSPGRARLAIEASAKHHLEAPDAAFKPASTAAKVAKPVSKPAPKPAAKPAPAPSKKAPTSPKPGPAESQRLPKISANERLVPVDKSSFDDDRLSDAFGGDDSSFTETMTGIIKTVGGKFAVGSTRDETPQVTEVVAPGIDSDEFGGSIFTNFKVLGIGAAALVVVAALAWWFFGGADDAATVDSLQLARPSITEQDPRQNRSRSLPADLSADERSALIEESLATAESALLARDTAQAAFALRRVAEADPGNQRLPFLNAQLSQMQLREYLDASRAAIRDGRFEDAAVALNDARALNPAELAEIELVSDELNAALSEQRVDDVLAKANARLDAGDLITPSNDNARYYYELALSNDPGNTAASQGLIAVASKLVLNARTEIDAGRFDSAQGLLTEAQRLDPRSGEVSSAIAAMNAARSEAADQQRLAEQRAAEERAAEQQAAEQRAADALAAEQAAAQTYAIEPTPADSMTDERTEVPADLGSETPPAETLAEAPQQDVTAAAVETQVQGNIRPTPIAASSLNRIKYVAPKYPRSAQRRGLEGWVEVEFVVDIDGSVTQVAVVNSEPGLTFVSAALKAVEGWKFEPVMENGVAVRKLAAVRMMFAVE